MIYTDGIHIVADSLAELHTWALARNIGKHWFHGMKKGHPHYDIPHRLRIAMRYMIKDGHVYKTDCKSILIISKRIHKTSFKI